jgi:hypothetical protein
MGAVSYSSLKPLLCFYHDMIWCLVGKTDNHCFLRDCGRSEDGKEGDEEGEDKEAHIVGLLWYTLVWVGECMWCM